MIKVFMRSRKIIVLISGEISCGKSKLSENLASKFDFKILKSKDALKQIAEEANKRLKEGRQPLMKIGEQLDKDTGGSWLRDFYQKDIIQNELVVIDAVRIAGQIDAFRQAYGHSVIHIHLKASPEELKTRFLERGEISDSEENLSKLYDGFKADKTERQVHTLESKADIAIDTGRNRPEDVLVRVASFLKILPSIDNRLVDVLVGAQFGSEGKGQVVAYLAPQYDCIVRVGGPNAGHKVYAEPKPHVFHILPSGSVKNPKAQLIIGPGAVISKEQILDEISKFNIHDPKRLIIDPNVTIISDADVKWEKDNDRIGSTAQGVGKATAENILRRIQENSSHKAQFAPELKQYIGSSHEALEKLFSSDKKILLEGTQGTHLSLYHGLYPHVTSRDTTAGGCLAEAGIAPHRVRKIIMVTRTYPIRVKNPDKGETSGSFESDELELDEIHRRSGIPLEELKATETTSTTHKQRRIAEFSWSLFRKSCELNSPTDIALTFADYFNISNREARRFDQLTAETIQFIEEIERCSGVPVSMIATRFSYRSIIDRRKWI
jgi:adenylosuccinate synthase